MSVADLLDEYDLTDDDIRWYLSSRLAESLILQKEDPNQLVRRIWSGELEAELYNLEERFLNRLQDELSRGLTDEPAIRDQLERARILKIHRRVG